jgi:Protein of unknown function (DUF2778)
MLKVRQYLEAYQLGTLTAREIVCIAVALTTASFLFAWLLEVTLSRQQISASSGRVLLVENSNPYYLFLDTRFDVYFSYETFSKTFLHPSDFQREIAAVSLTLTPSLSSLALSPNTAPTTTSLSSLEPRPAAVPPPSRQQPSASEVGAQNSEKPESPNDNNGFQRFFAKLFGKLSSSPVKLASAATDDSQLDAVSITSRYDQRTAVYDISSRTVYMPDGTKLEAHSGFGDGLDDPAQVESINLGPTPPNVYNLEMRERPFHGVRALRLIPIDTQKTLGRTGLLAHSFMLGPNGQSNGCVSIKDYDAFLRAYTNHQVKRLVVVARLD